VKRPIKLFFGFSDLRKYLNLSSLEKTEITLLREMSLKDKATVLFSAVVCNSNQGNCTHST
jgi:hypothetical protein